MAKKYYKGREEINEFLKEKALENSEITFFMRGDIVSDVIVFEKKKLTAQLCEDEDKLGFILDAYKGEDFVDSKTYWIEDYQED